MVIQWRNNESIFFQYPTISYHKRFAREHNFFQCKKDKLFYIDGENKFHITDLLHKHTNAIIPLNEALGAEKFLSYKFYVDDNLDIWVYSSNTEGLWLFSQNTNNTWKLSTIGKNTLLLKNKVISICEDNFHKYGLD